MRLKLGKTALFGSESLEEGPGTLCNLNNFKANGNSESRDPTEATTLSLECAAFMLVSTLIDNGMRHDVYVHF